MQAGINRGSYWTTVAEILNLATGLTFGVNQRSNGNIFFLPERYSRKKLGKKSSGIASPDLTKHEIAIPEITVKTEVYKYNYFFKDVDYTKQDLNKRTRK